MNQTNTVLNSVHDNTITPDDAMRILVPDYMPNWEEDLGRMPTAEAIRDLLRDMLSEGQGTLPDHRDFIDFHICPQCDELTVWDNVHEIYRHLILSDCPVNPEPVVVVNA